MDQTNILLAILTLTVSAVLVYSNVRHIPYQTAVRSLAVWMLVMLLLALAYRSFGPFAVNTADQPAVAPSTATTASPPGNDDKNGKTMPADKGAADSYTPPNE